MKATKQQEAIISIHSAITMARMAGLTETEARRSCERSLTEVYRGPSVR